MHSARGLRDDDIQQFHERRIKVRDGKADLPKRLVELAATDADLRRLAAELEWDAQNVDKLIARIPSLRKAERGAHS